MIERQRVIHRVVMLASEKLNIKRASEGERERERARERESETERM